MYGAKQESAGAGKELEGILEGGWHPDERFLEFLETIKVGGPQDPDKRGQISSHADFFMKQMRKGSFLGRYVYANTWNDPKIQQRYRLYLELKDRTPV